MTNRVPPKTSNPNTQANPNTQDQKHNREQESPKRPWPESWGGQEEAKGVADARNKSTRTGER